MEVFTFKGIKYQQDAAKVEQQKAEAKYVVAKFCDKCPQELQDACFQCYYHGEESWEGDDCLELRKVKKDCRRFGRPEKIES